MTDDREEASHTIVPGVGDKLTKPALGLIRRGLQELSILKDDQKCDVGPGERPRVLLVDDQETLIEVFGPILAEAGYEVRSSLNATEAIEIARKFQPHVALLGLIMPVMDGVRLGMELSDFLPKTKIVLWSEVDGSEDLDDLARQGYRFALLPSPFEKKKLLENMHHWVLLTSCEDSLTGLSLEPMLNFAVNVYIDHRTAFSIIFFNILEHWHQETAAVSSRQRRKLLAELARAVNAKSGDPCFQDGENSFALLLLQQSNDYVEEMKNKLSELIHETDWQQLTGCHVSLSVRFAVVSFPQDGQTIEKLIAKAMVTLSEDTATS